MGSMAFWYEKNPLNSDKPLSAVMNFNLWTQCDSTSNSFLDIGFLVSNITAAKKLYYYIPFGKSSVEDLSGKICNSSAIGAIFNEKYSVIDLSDTDRFWPVNYEAEQTSDQNAFVIYSWDTDDDPAVTSFSTAGCDGVCLEIDVDKIAHQIESLPSSRFNKEDKFYFRFRVDIPAPKQNDTIVRKYTPPNSFLQSTFATTYIVDFRFNDMRSLPRGISDKIVKKGNDFVDVSKLHFLLMTKAHVDVETGAKDISLRELEDKTWDEYIDQKFETKDIVAFHCAEKAKPIRQWEFFAKIKVNNSTWKIIVVYLLVLAVITIMFNLLSNMIWELLKNLLDFVANIAIDKPV